ncbi:hypothetical protein [Shinella sp. G-2]|uniref:hypothetical protein n=1 Tax=Shinella sp. G-2 TaxID=3133141 RepID=UPI003D05727F
MFGKKTVFVVGAGAGVEYHMPMGKELKSSIESKLTANEDPLWHSLAAPLALANQNEAMKYHELKKFIASNMGRAESIDNFLHTHSENHNLVTIGKTAIALCILEAERGSSFMPYDKRNNDPFSYLRTVSDSWLTRFCTMALTGILRSEARHAFDNVTIVTFNYDRCIEMYLVDHIKDYLGMRVEEAREIVDAINIIHVYGKVGKLPWQKGPAPEVAYGMRLANEQLLTVSQQIRTFTERLDQDDTQQRIETELADAELVVFSGFSYGSSNWEFLQNATPGPRKNVIAGVYGISEPNQANIANRLRNELHPGAEVVVHTCQKGFLDLLYDYSTFFE